MVGNIVVAAAPLLLLPSDPPVRDVLLLISFLIITLVPLTAAPLAITTRDHPLSDRTDFNFIAIFGALKKNGPLCRYLTALLCNFISVGALNSVAIFLIDIGLGLPGKFFSLFFIQYMVAIISVPLLVRLGHRFNKHQVLTASFVVMIFYYLVSFTLPMGNYYLFAGFDLFCRPWIRLRLCFRSLNSR